MQKRIDLNTADRTLPYALRLQRTGARVAHAHVATGDGSGVSGCAPASVSREKDAMDAFLDQKQDDQSRLCLLLRAREQVTRDDTRQLQERLMLHRCFKHKQAS